MPDVISDEVTSYPYLILPGEILSAVLDQPLKLGPGLCHMSSIGSFNPHVVSSILLLFSDAQLGKLNSHPCPYLPPPHELF